MTARGLAGLAAVTVAVAGCGSGQLPPASGVDPANQLLSQAAVDKAPAGPERALYQWWLYVQYNDLAGYKRMLAPDLRNGAPVAHELSVASRALDVALPIVQSIVRHGRTATVYANVLYHQLVGSKRFVSVQAPQAFSLVHASGRWYIADEHFIEQAAG